jgi:hypothetical protein
MPDWQAVNAGALVQTAAPLVQALVERAEWQRAVRPSGPSVWQFIRLSPQ